MNKKEFVARISNQLRTTSKDEYISDRFILSIGESLAKKFITQKLQQRSIDKDMSLYKEIKCIEFEPVDFFTCEYVEFRNCDKLSKSKKEFKDLIYTRYGSTIKELYTIDRKSKVYTESSIYDFRNNSLRKGYNQKNDKFYILNGYIYITDEVEVLSGLVLNLDEYESDDICGCTEDCKSAWEYDFKAPDSMLEDIINYTIQNVIQTKQIPPDENPNLNENIK